MCEYEQVVHVSVCGCVCGGVGMGSVCGECVIGGGTGFPREPPQTLYVRNARAPLNAHEAPHGAPGPAPCGPHSSRPRSEWPSSGAAPRPHAARCTPRAAAADLAAHYYVHPRFPTQLQSVPAAAAAVPSIGAGVVESSVSTGSFFEVEEEGGGLGEADGDVAFDH